MKHMLTCIKSNLYTISMFGIPTTGSLIVIWGSMKLYGRVSAYEICGVFVMFAISLFVWLLSRN